MNRRTDYHTALLIDAILNERERVGVNNSARALYELGVPVEVAVRLLTRPWDRRTYASMPPSAFLV